MDWYKESASPVLSLDLLDQLVELLRQGGNSLGARNHVRRAENTAVVRHRRRASLLDAHVFGSTINTTRQLMRSD